MTNPHQNKPQSNSPDNSREKKPVSFTSLNSLKRKSSPTTATNLTKRLRRPHSQLPSTAPPPVNPFHRYVSAAPSRGNIKRISSTISHNIKSAHAILDPSSILKELIENAIDAHASSIQIRVRGRAALDSLVVTDDGTGIPSDSHQTLCQPSTTSKFSSMHDFLNLSTFGFRGQALAAIAALAGSLTIITRTQPMSVAVQLSYDANGELLESKDVPRTRGTTINVQNVFARLPVRKEAATASSATEISRVVTIVQTLALALPHIAFQLRVENTLRVSASSINKQVASTDDTTPASVEALRSRAHAVLGRRTVSTLLSVQTDDLLELQSPPDELADKTQDNVGKCKIRSLISPALLDAQGTGRARSSAHFVFLNRRPVTMPALNKAVTELYRKATGLVSAAPVLIICVYLPAWTFDINIAPDKTEVALWDEPAFVQAILKLFETVWIPTQESVIPTGQRLMKDVILGRRKYTDGDKVETGSEQEKKHITIHPSDTISTQTEQLGDKNLVTEYKGSTENDTNAKVVPLENNVNDNKCADEGDDEGSNRNSQNANELRVSQDKEVSLNVPSEPSVSDIDDIELSRTETPVSLDSQGTEVPTNNATKTQKPYQTVTKDMIARQDETTNKTTVQNNGQACRRRFREKMLSTGQRGKPNISSFIARRSGAVASSSVTNQLPRSQEPEAQQSTTSTGKTSSCEPERVDTASGLTARGRKLLAQVDTEKNSIDEDEEEAEKNNEANVEERVDKQSLEVTYTMDEERDKSRRQQQDSIPIVAVDWETICSKTSLTHKEDTSSSYLDSKERDSKAEFQSASLVNCSENDIAARYRQENADREMSRLFRQKWFREMKIIGQFNRGFIICRLGDDLFIIDQHASDEKYNFEELQRTTKIDMQRLVRPIPLEMSAQDELIVAQHIRAFRAGGFDIDYRTDNSPTKRLYLRAQPISKHTLFVEDDLQDIVNILKSGVMQDGTLKPKILRPPRVRAMFASRACRKSVMIGDALSRKSMIGIVSNLAQIEHPWTCPHGRPTMRHLWTLP